jgi:NADH dehydrogenase
MAPFRFEEPRKIIMMNIVVVGGGAGGLELATSLGRKLGKKNKARITLVDRNRTHLWKPLLHEVATGSMDAGIDALSYQSHAKNHGFEFQLGSLTDIKRDEKRIVLAPIHDESGALPSFPYDDDHPRACCSLRDLP